MIKQFLIERWPWFTLFISMQMIIFITSWLDVGMSINGAIYLIGLNCLLLFVFVFMIYTRETRFYKALVNNTPLKEIEHKELNHSVYEKLIFDYIQGYEEQTRKTIHEQNKEITIMKDDLLDWIHEVKTPITAMKLLTDQIDDIKLKQDILYEWSRIDYLLDQQLYIKRLSSKSNDFYFGHYNLRNMVINEIQYARNISIAKGIGYDLDIDAYNVYTDEKWFRTILRQIISNALKYTDNGDISIRTYKLKEKIYLEIKDEGRGIQTRDLPRIFDRGFTSTTSKRESTATGMGLYLVKQISKGLGITVNIKSEFGEGTTVLIIFSNPNEYTSIELAK
ncbi:sensor histidine kinase [Mammaliicoccus stepanovicii]|uniref:histidine kinase n=1 Tax=Mammaliicoccus stepanovicii TaxID=643214 RepID=A0A239YID9_9STAP|nr:sensor histidine kinase [Mammaliicoccus stepanovicii]PNZ75708.1 sensor histidine kinase [Mammaliicoccus stepanovicii]GGI40763.1 sensor histidine kinase GraS [Mammaliicoccus stepanovicii]SNV58008.1 two-component sensor histidine kinase BceS [Mammaliicoccus stepanovicii]